MKQLTPVQRRTLERAASRQRGNVCPMPGIHAAAQMAVIEALLRKGYITDNRIPFITEQGRAALVECDDL